MSLGRFGPLAPGAQRTELVHITDERICTPFSLFDSAVTTIFWTYNFDLSAIDATTRIEAFLILQSSTDLDVQEIELDLRRGGQYSMVGTHFRVYGAYPPVTGSKQPLLEVNIGGGRGAIAPAGFNAVSTRTIVLPNNPLTPVLIPKKAVSAILAAPGPAPAALLDQRQGVGGAILSEAPLGFLERDAVPIVNGATTFTVAGAPAGSRIIFNIG